MEVHFAVSPFDKSSVSADATIVTLDNVRFRIHKLILAQASTYFASIFSGEPATDESGLVPFVEDSAKVDVLLRLIYPIADPPLTKLEDVVDMIVLARKYGFDGVRATCAKALLSPELTRRGKGNWPRITLLLDVFAAAYDACFDAVARTAAKDSLQYPFNLEEIRPSKELGNMSAAALVWYVHYRKACAQAAIKAIEDGFKVYEDSSEPYSYAYRCDDPACPHREEGSPGNDGMFTDGFDLDKEAYLDHMARVLRKTPSPDAIERDPCLLGAVFLTGETPRCRSCLISIACCTQQILLCFMDAVERAVDQVNLQVGWTPTAKLQYY